MVRETFSEVRGRLRSGEESSGQSGLLKGANFDSWEETCLFEDH